jgi:hypothetical protein
MTKAQDQKDEREAAQTAERERIERESAAEIERNNQQAMTDRKPAANKPAGAERKVDQPQTDSAARLRAFEDEVFGKRAVRIEGKIERGVGSPYAAMSDEQKAQYAALEAVVVAEQRLNDATAAVAQAEADRVVAEENLARCGKMVEEKAVEAKADKAEAEKDAAQDKSETEKTHKDKAHAAGA